MKRRSHGSRWATPLFATITLLLLIAFAPPARAQETTGPPPEPVITEDGILFNERLQVSQLINFAAERLDISFIWDDATQTLLTGPQAPSIVLRQQRPISDEHLFDFLEAVLLTLSGNNALVITETAKPDLYRLSVQARGGATASDQIYVLGPELQLPEVEATVITVVLGLDDSTAPQTMMPAFTSLMGGPQAGGSATAIGQTGLLMLTGSRSRIEAALDVVKQIPEDSTELVFEVVELQNLDPQTAVAPIQSMIAMLVSQHQQSSAGQPGGRNPRVNVGTVTAIPGTRKIVILAPRSLMPKIHELIEQIDSGEPMTGEMYPVTVLDAEDFANIARQVLSSSGARGRGAGAGQATVEVLGNVVVVYGSATDHEKVEELMAKFEELPAHQRQVVRYIQVKHRPADELMDVLEGLFSEGIIEGDVDRGAAPGRGGTRQQPNRPQREGAAETQQPGVAGPPGGVSLSGENDVLLDLTLDGPTNTIIARGEALMVDQVEQIITDLDVRQAQVRLEFFLVSLSENQALNLGVELEGDFEIGATSFNLASLFGLGVTPGQGVQPSVAGTGFTGLAVNPGDFSAIVRALETVGAGSSISKPYLVVNNNAEAELRGVALQPYVVTNQGETTTSESYGGDKEAGTILSITPQIAEGSHLILDYTVELSSFTGEAVGVLPPPSREDSVSSSVTIPDGYTVIVGGLEDRSQTETANQVPILGEIPFLGELFKSKTKSGNRNRLYIFVSASIE
ncbi:MAG: secretin N-terminal domain-containing protein, partial [Phycisphaerales bacterium JB038]